MSVLITGGAGYIGAHMAWFCRDKKIPYVVLDDLSSGFVENIPPDSVFIKGDIADQKLLLDIHNAHKIESVIHFAAKIIVAESVERPLEYYHNNAAKTAILLDWVIKSQIKHFVFSSTAAVYGDVDAGLLSENLPKYPASPYGRSKWMVEQMLQDAHDAYGLHYAALRYFNVAGADPSGRAGQSGKNASHLIKIACQAALGTRESLAIFGQDYPTKDGTCIRDYVHVSDLVQAHGLALEYICNTSSRLIANCGYGNGFSVHEVVNTVKEISGFDFPVRLAERRAGDPSSLVADGQLLRQALGWLPQYDDLKIIVRHALEWEKKITNFQV